MKPRQLNLSSKDLSHLITEVFIKFWRPQFLSPDQAIEDIRSFFGISKKKYKSLEVASLVRRMADMRVETIRRFSRSLIPGLFITSNKNYYIKVLCYHYGSAIGYWNESVRRNWSVFFLTDPKDLLDPYSTTSEEKREAKKKKSPPKPKRETIYSVMEDFFVKGGKTKDCLYLLLDKFPTKTKIAMMKTMKMYLYKFRKEYTIKKDPKTNIVTFTKE